MERKRENERGRRQGQGVEGGEREEGRESF